MCGLIINGKDVTEWASVGLAVVVEVLVMEVVVIIGLEEVCSSGWLTPGLLLLLLLLSLIGAEVSTGVPNENSWGTQQRKKFAPHVTSSRTLSQNMDVIAWTHSPGQAGALPTDVKLLHKSNFIKYKSFSALYTMLSLCIVCFMYRCFVWHIKISAWNQAFIIGTTIQKAFIILHIVIIIKFYSNTR